MKKELLLIVLSLLILTGCNDSKMSAIESLDGNDLTVYKMMLEVCYNAADPSKVSVISGSVTDEIGVFKVSYDGEETYNVLISYKGGDYVVEKLHDQLAKEYKNLLYETDDFSMKKVNAALNEKWNK